MELFKKYKISLSKNNKNRDWRNAVFTDELSFNLHNKRDSRLIIQKKRIKLLQNELKCICMWSYRKIGEISLEIFEGKMDSQKYVII